MPRRRNLRFTQLLCAHHWGEGVQSDLRTFEGGEARRDPIRVVLASGCQEKDAALGPPTTAVVNPNEAAPQLREMTSAARGQVPAVLCTWIVATESRQRGLTLHPSWTRSSSAAPGAGR